MINDDFDLNFNIPNLPNIDDISIPDGNQLQSIPSFSSMNFIIDEKGLINPKENFISPQFKEINIDNYKLKDNKSELLDNICEINKVDKTSINIEKDIESVKPFKILKTNNLKLKESKILLNKKRKNNSNEKHTKFAEDNIERKCINIILNICLEFINKRIKKIYNGNIGKGVNCKQLFSINLQPYFYTVDFKKNLLHKTLGEIFSDQISMKYTNYLSNFNIMMIESLLNEKEQDKKKIFRKTIWNYFFTMC